MRKTSEAVERAGARHNPPPILTGMQIRAARAALRWNSKRLAQEADVGIVTIHRAEAGDGQPGLHAASLGKIKGALERAGIEFLRPGEVSQGYGIAISLPEDR